MGPGLLRAGNTAVIRSSSPFLRTPRFRWSAVAAYTLGAWLIAFAVMASAGRARLALPSIRIAPAPVAVSLEADAVTMSRVDVPMLGLAGPIERDVSSASLAADPCVDPSLEAMSAAGPVMFQEEHAPVALARISSTFGVRPNPLGSGYVFHRGIDFAAPTGTPVYAVAGGTVVKAYRSSSYGNVVVIDHHNGYATLYAHASKLLVKSGERVAAGEQIAKVGSTGHATGPHLHFEIQHSGQRINPGPYLAGL